MRRKILGSVLFWSTLRDAECKVKVVDLKSVEYCGRRYL